jgi:hypothetical protein
VGGSLIVQRNCRFQVFAKNYNQRTGWLWVFEKNQNQRNARSGYFKILKNRWVS